MDPMPGMGGLPPFDRHALFTTWQWRPGWLLIGLVALVVYLVAARAAARRGRRPGVPLIAAFVGGIVVAEVTLGSAINAYAMSLFWMHMVEHLLLIMVIPAMLVLGHPIRVTADALPDPTRGRVLAFWRSRPIGVLTVPLVGILVYGLVIVGTHLSGFMNQMATHAWLMTAEEALYLVAGIWLLLPLLTREPLRWDIPYVLRIALLLIAMVPDTIVGIVLMQTSDDPFPAMLGHTPGAPDPVTDVHTGGALRWAAGDGLMMVFAIGVVVAMIVDRDEQRRGFGTWLEGVRQRTLVAHVGHGDDVLAEDADPDGEDALAAYNRMLGRLGDPRG